MKFDTGELHGNLTRRLSFRLHLSNLTTASHKTYLHFCADVLWYPCSVHVHFLTSLETNVWKTESDLATFKTRVPQMEA
jgi:hypothetical protein